MTPKEAAEAIRAILLAMPGFDYTSGCDQTRETLDLLELCLSTGDAGPAGVVPVLRRR